jgi:CubicO group peptidase (beta-lactamase class C family)
LITLRHWIKKAGKKTDMDYKTLSLKKKIFYFFLTLLLLLITAGVVYLSSLLPIMTGYAAKNLCSGVFIADRDQEDLEANDLNFFPVNYVKNRVNYSDSSVTSRFLWGSSRAIDLEEYGALLLRKSSAEELRRKTFPVLPDPGYESDSTEWPLGNIIPDTVTGINTESLEIITNDLITRNSYGGNAYSFMVLHKGMPVAEAYKPGFGKNSLFLSWSMAKSVTNALIGILVKKGFLDIYEETDIELWQNDARKEITINDIMQMQSGLRWNEDYGNRSDVTLMLTREKDMAEFAYDQPLEFEPGTHFEYSSGMANVLCYLIRKRINNDSIYYTFPYTDLFYKTGITNAIFETDLSGTFVGSSYLYATLRDYARFGLLYIREGNFNGEQILPEGWTDYTRTPASASEGEYGSLFWLNGKGEVPSAPDDTYMCIGHDGQRIFIIPSKDLVVVVLGYSPNGAMDFDRLLNDILKTV